MGVVGKRLRARRGDLDAHPKAVVRGKADPSNVPADGATRVYLMLAP